MKPKIIILYNDITNCDLKYLYKEALIPFNYSEVEFIVLSNFIKNINSTPYIALYDYNFFTNFKLKEKTKELPKEFSNYIVIGKTDDSHVHYANKEIIWQRFKEIYKN